MKKILVSVYVLSLDNTYDIELPINLQMKDALELIQTAIKDLSYDVYQPKIDAKLYESFSGKVLNVGNIVKYSGIKNGETVMLV